jgi:DNA-binding NarL/FixJ family response regulator
MAWRTGGVSKVGVGDEHRLARILLVDDQDFMRAGLRSVLSREKVAEVVGEARTGREAVDLCQRLRPDLVLMDVEMPEMDGLSATRRIKKEHPTTVVLIVTAHNDLDYLMEAVQAGAAGYVLKEDILPRVASVVRSALAGDPVLDPGMSLDLLRRLSSQHREAESRTSRTTREKIEGALTGREREVLTLIALGRTNQEIASELFLGVGTVKTHVHRIIQKLGVSDRTQAAITAIRHGIANPGD